MDTFTEVILPIFFGISLFVILIALTVILTKRHKRIVESWQGQGYPPQFSCPSCRVPMVLGEIVNPQFQVWVKSPVERGFGGGVKNMKNTENYVVNPAARCPSCGALQYFAKGSSTPQKIHPPAA